MPDFPIDKDVPAPTRRRHGPQYKYPFKLMKVGDSFYVAGRATSIISVRSALNRFIKVKSPTWEFRTQQDANGVRIWRIK